jgi:hypothetical protein
MKNATVMRFEGDSRPPGNASGERTWCSAAARSLCRAPARCLASSLVVNGPGAPRLLVLFVVLQRAVSLQTLVVNGPGAPRLLVLFVVLQRAVSLLP